MEEDIDNYAKISINYVIYIVTASIITSLSIAINDTTPIVGAMIISPLLRPLYGIMVGILNKDIKLIFKSLLTEILGCVFAFIIGCIAGIILTIFSKSVCDPSQTLLCWPTSMMFRLGSWAYLIVGFIIGSSCGVVAGLAYKTKTLENFIGAAISVSLLPPICNSGMMLIYGSFGNLINIYGGFTSTIQIDSFRRMGISIMVFLINVFSLLLTGTITLYFNK